MAATTGFGRVSTRLTISCPSKLSRSASVWVVSAVNSSMSAPAMKLSGLPEISTTARIAVVVPQPDQQRLELRP